MFAFGVGGGGEDSFSSPFSTLLFTRFSPFPLRGNSSYFGPCCIPCQLGFGLAFRKEEKYQSLGFTIFIFYRHGWVDG